MKAVFDGLLLVHAATGIAALGLFWVPAIARKGSRLHRQAGKLFLLSMGLVAITGVPLAIDLLMKGQWVFAVFLLYLAVLLIASTGSAWGALKLKREPQRYFGHAYVAVAWLLLLSGITVSVLGYAFDVSLLLVFGFIGPFVAFDMFRRKRETQRPANWWLLEHFGGMIGSGIATHVAFGAFGLRRLWPAYASLEGWVGMLPWIVPVVIGVAASVWLEKHYAQKPPVAKATV